MYASCQIGETYYWYDKKGGYFKSAGLRGQMVRIEYSEYKTALRESILCKV